MKLYILSCGNVKEASSLFTPLCSFSFQFFPLKVSLRKHQDVSAILKLHNSLDGQKVPFHPLRPDQVTMYVCGPTVYDRIHLGNARSEVVFDVLFRLLRYAYPSVTYVRNITDVEDKINVAAHQRGVDIHTLTTETTQWFHDDVRSSPHPVPTHEPLATDHIAGMIRMIQDLVHKGLAYEVREENGQAHVLFAVTKWPGYGELSKMPLDQMKCGARVETAPYKRRNLWTLSCGNLPMRRAPSQRDGKAPGARAGRAGIWNAPP